MRSIIVVWTEETNRDNYPGDTQKTETDFYEVFEEPILARERYKEVLEQPNLLVASITGVIESTDYEPYKF